MPVVIIFDVCFAAIRADGMAMYAIVGGTVCPLFLCV